MIVGKVPFFSNTKDDTHCVQACFTIILKYFLPKRNFTFKEMDILSKKSKNRGTWWFPAETRFAEMGFEVLEISDFDYEKFYQEGKGYLYEAYDKEQVEWYLKHSNILQVRNYIPNFMQKVTIKKRKAIISDFESLLSRGYLLISDINANTLNSLPGYISHAVVLYGFDKRHFYLHDPGLPPRKSLKVTKELFVKAGGNNLAAFKI